MFRGSNLAFTAALGLPCVGCFNPAATEETSAASTSTSAPTSQPITGDPSTVTTTPDSLPTTGMTDTNGVTGTTSTTGTTTGTTTSTTETTDESTTATDEMGFTALGPFSVPGALAIATARLDADDTDDLVISNKDLPNLSYVVSSGLSQVKTISAGISFPVVATDINSDGRSEIVLGYLDKPGTLHIRDAMTFPALGDYKLELPVICERPISIDTGKFNDDEHLDYVIVCAEYSTGVYVVLGNLPDLSPPVAVELGITATFARVQQVFSTSYPDLVVTSYNDEKVYIFAGTGDGTFPTIGALSYDVPLATSLAFGDVDDDAEQVPDLVVMSLTSDTSWLLTGIKDLGFAPPTAIPCGPDLRDLTLGDFNGDQRDDLATLHLDNHMRVALNVGNGAYSAPLLFDIGPSAWRVTTGDYNGDDRLDIAATSENRLDIFLNTMGD